MKKRKERTVKPRESRRKARQSDRFPMYVDLLAIRGSAPSGQIGSQKAYRLLRKKEKYI